MAGIWYGKLGATVTTTIPRNEGRSLLLESRVMTLHPKRGLPSKIRQGSNLEGKDAFFLSSSPFQQSKGPSPGNPERQVI
jgi:hypothetical protein